MAVLFPVFKEISTLFSIAAVLVCIPTNSVRGFPFLYTLQHLLLVDFWIAAILTGWALFLVQLSHVNMTTGKTIVLTSRAFVDKVMSLLFNLLSRLVIAFLSRTKCLLISWLQSASTVILEPKKIVYHCFHCFPSICHELMILVFWMFRFKPAFSLSFHFNQETLKFLFEFCHKGCVIFISEVIEISPGSLEPSLCFFQPSVSHDVLCI